MVFVWNTCVTAILMIRDLKRHSVPKKNDLIIIFIMREYKYVYFQIYYLIEQTHAKYKYTYIQNMSNKNR